MQQGPRSIAWRELPSHIRNALITITLAVERPEVAVGIDIGSSPVDELIAHDDTHVRNCILASRRAVVRGLAKLAVLHESDLRAHFEEAFVRQTLEALSALFGLTSALGRTPS